MVIITYKKIREYALGNQLAKIPLLHWYNIVYKANWSCIADLKKDFPSADYVGNDRYVFNIKGNKFRLIAIIHFDTRTLYVRFIGTHSEYDKIIAYEV